MKGLLQLIMIVMLAGCQSSLVDVMEEVKQEKAQANEFKNICITAVTDTPFVNATADIKKTEFPAGFDTSTLSAEQFLELTTCPQ